MEEQAKKERRGARNDEMVYVIRGADPDVIYESGQVFRWEQYGPGEYLAVCGENAALLIKQKDGTAVVPVLNGDGADEETFWAQYLDAGEEYTGYWRREWAAERAGTTRAEAIGEAIGLAQGMRILRQDLWEAAVCFVISQNNNMGRIRKSVTALRERLGRRCAGQDRVNGRFVTVHLMPTAQQIVDAGPLGLQGLGLGYRDRYLYQMAMHWEQISGQLAQAQTPGERRRILKAVSGIGDKVADCICLYGLHDLDAVPMDVWMKRITEQAFGGVFPADKKYAGYLQQILFYAAANDKAFRERYANRDKTEKGAQKQ